MEHCLLGGDSNDPACLGIWQIQWQNTGDLLWFAWRYCIVAHTEKWYSVCCVTDDPSAYDPAWRVTVIYDK